MFDVDGFYYSSLPVANHDLDYGTIPINCMALFMGVNSNPISGISLFHCHCLCSPSLTFKALLVSPMYWCGGSIECLCWNALPRVDNIHKGGHYSLENTVLEGTTFTKGEHYSLENTVLEGTTFTKGGHYSLENTVLEGTTFTKGEHYSLVNTVLEGTTFTKGEHYSLVNTVLEETTFTKGGTLFTRECLGGHPTL